VGDRKKKSRKKKPPSALSVRPGTTGGHDGMPAARGSERAPRRTAAPRTEPGTREYVAGVLAGDRTVLGRAITLVESNAPEHQDQAQEVLKELSPRAGRSIRVGITGVPGAGKSLFIETLGTALTEGRAPGGSKHKVAVLAVDPSSSVSGGSILGDKTRMERLSRNPRAFIRPSPTGGTLGGVARKTRETMLLFEAAGFDVLLVETVGVGQNEIAVRSMVDFFLLLLVAGAGDELQGIKKGVIEIADAVVVNKADGENRIAAEAARDEYARALHYIRPATGGWRTEAFTTSALTGDGVDTIWKTVEKFQAVTVASGVFDRRRREQTRDWLHQMIAERLSNTFYNHPAIAGILPSVEREVIDGTLPAARAAMSLLEKFEEAHGRSD